MVTSALAPDVLANTCATTGQHASMPIRPDLAVERGIVTLTSGFVNFLEPARLGDVLVSKPTKSPSVGDQPLRRHGSTGRDRDR